MTEVERYLTPGELAMALSDLGVRGFDSTRAANNLVVVMRRDQAGVICGNQVRVSAALDWLHAHPQWRPFTRKDPVPGLFVGAGR